MKKLTAEWVRKAEVDYRGTRQLARRRVPMHDHRCFLCQQAAEKYLTALMEERRLTVPRSHDLEDLLASLRPVHRDLAALRRGAKFLIPFAVDVRYPGFRATKRQAQAALRWAGRIRAAIRSLLGFRRH